MSRVDRYQVRSVAVERIGKQIDRLPAATMAKLDEALCVHLAL